MSCSSCNDAKKTISGTSGMKLVVCKSQTGPTCPVNGRPGPAGATGVAGVAWATGVAGATGADGATGTAINGLFVQTNVPQEPAHGDWIPGISVGTEYSLIGVGLGNLTCSNVATGDTYLLRIAGTSSGPTDTLGLDLYYNTTSTSLGQIPVFPGDGIWWLEIWYTFRFFPPGPAAENYIHVNYVRDGLAPRTVRFFNYQYIPGTDVDLIVTVTKIINSNEYAKLLTESAVLTKLY